MNTIKLISHWNMSGALDVNDGRFRVIDDIGTAIQEDQPTLDPTAPDGTSSLIKESEDESWQLRGE